MEESLWSHFYSSSSGIEEVKYDSNSLEMDMELLKRDDEDEDQTFIVLKPYHHEELDDANFSTEPNTLDAWTSSNSYDNNSLEAGDVDYVGSINQSYDVFLEGGGLEMTSCRSVGDEDLDRPFKCDKCDSAFPNKSSLDIHARIHMDVKPYKCDECSATFSQKGHLERHYRRHTGERPFKCEHCETAFSRKGNLHRHIRIHTGEKPYKCDVCGAAFTQKYSLQKHARIHNVGGTDKNYK